MTFDQWFRSQQCVAYEGSYLFAEAAWNAALENAIAEAMKRYSNTLIYGTSHPEMLFGKSFASMPEYMAEQEDTNRRLRETLDRIPETNNQQGRK